MEAHSTSAIMNQEPSSLCHLTSLSWQKPNAKPELSNANQSGRWRSKRKSTINSALISISSTWRRSNDLRLQIKYQFNRTKFVFMDSNSHIFNGRQYKSRGMQRLSTQESFPRFHPCKLFRKSLISGPASDLECTDSSQYFSCWALRLNFPWSIGEFRRKKDCCAMW